MIRRALLPGYVVGAGGCVDGAAVAGFGGGKKKKTKGESSLMIKVSFIRCIKTRSKFRSHPISVL